MNWGLLAARIAAAMGIVAAAIIALVLLVTTTFGPSEPNDPLFQQLANEARAAALSPTSDWVDVSNKVCPLVDAAKLDRLLKLTDIFTKSKQGHESYGMEVSPWPVQNCLYRPSRRRDLDIVLSNRQGQCQATVTYQHTCDP
jgi:hypothetical protein